MTEFLEIAILVVLAMTVTGSLIVGVAHVGVHGFAVGRRPERGRRRRRV